MGRVQFLAAPLPVDPCVVTGMLPDCQKRGLALLALPAGVQTLCWPLRGAKMRSNSFAAATFRLFQIKFVKGTVASGNRSALMLS